MKNVVVVGASSGIGLACALHLARRGHRVFATSRTPTPADAPFEYVPMDVTSETSVEHAIGVILEQAGHIDAVVNSAGFGLAGAVEDTSIAEAQQQFEGAQRGAVPRAARPRRARGPR